MLVIWCTGTLRHFIRPALREINYCCRYVIPEKEEKWRLQKQKKIILKSEKKNILFLYAALIFWNQCEMVG